MYDELDVVTIAKTLAEKEIEKDRAHYQCILTIIEKFIYNHGLVVAGESANRLASEINNTARHLHHFEVYSSGGDALPRKLAKEICGFDPGGLTRYTVMITQSSGCDYTIAVDGRELVHIRNLPSHRGVDTFSLLSPIRRKGVFDRKGLLCISPDLQLINVYTLLTEVTQAKFWPDLLGYERSLRQQFISKRTKQSFEASGHTKKYSPRPLIEILLNEFVTNPKRIVVGDYAHSLYTKDRQTSAQTWRLQIITSMPLRQEAETVKSIANRLHTNVQVTYNDPRIPTDIHLRRLTFYIIQPGRKHESFLDIYNSSNYSLIPHIKASELMPPSPHQLISSKTNIGTLFVQARFLLIEHWTINLLSQMSAITCEQADSLLYKIAAKYRQIMSLEWPETDKLFPPDSKSYTGVHRDTQLTAKREILIRNKQKSRFVPPYYPIRDLTTDQNRAASDASENSH